jgi:aminoglycoside phosphotransferase (APT) family kinase protein
MQAGKPRWKEGERNGMLKPEQEVSAKYLRTLRQTLSEVILPEVASAAGRNALTLCDYVLVRMIAALDEVPGVQADHEGRFATLLGRAVDLSGEALRGAAVDPDRAARLQLAIPGLFEGAGAAGAAAQQLGLLAEIGAAEDALRRDYEAAAKRAGEVKLPMPASLGVTGEAVQAYLDQKFSQKINLRSCYQIPGGRSKLTVLLEVEPNDVLPEAMVIRIDGPDSAINTTVLDEFPILDVMYKSGIAAPEPLWVEADANFLGAPFLVMRRMPGKAAGDLWAAEQVSPAIGVALAQALASVHGARIETVWPEAPRDARTAVAEMLGSFESGWRAGNSTPSLAMECAYGWLKRQLSRIEGPTVTVHGDAHFANLLAQGDELVCLLDWEFTHPGHPAEDLAYCRTYVEKIMKWDDFMRHYRAHGGLPVSEAQLEFFAVWGYLRNVTFSANMLRDFNDGKVHGIQNLAIALNTRSRLEALLAHEVARALQREAAG